ncbi:ComEC/Rec2 family competence protein [Sphingobacterium hotanense]|uniref:ComEC/Rec2 family competence protein n=1 Tax=Sphingobacterium hotanense TaxID=649196 RepID=UPI001659B172|nr:MBL fold metallo-hydrolase [Sphingobacterium hotanense]
MIILLLICSPFLLKAQQQIGKVFPQWQQGYLDLHHINTGRGECLFAIFPDGTTMLVDAGETGTDQRNFRPNASQSAGQWIARYIKQMMKPLQRDKIDQVLLTHFHDDHMGNVELSDRKSAHEEFILTGITEVGELIPFDRLVDRAWPDYSWPTPLSEDKTIGNYLKFVEKLRAKQVPIEKFMVGSEKQFKLYYNSDNYPSFKVRNIAANGIVWTGVEQVHRNYFPPIEYLNENDYPEENAISTVFKISYGKFDYFNGADLVSKEKPGHWKQIELPVGLVTGPVEVCEVNHHGKDAMSKEFVSALSPRVFLIQGFALSHPDAVALENMLSQKVYPGERDVFCSNLFDANRKVLGSELVDQIKSTQGHMVVRVHPGGEKYQVIILDDSNENYTIKSIHGPYESK